MEKLFAGLDIGGQSIKGIVLDGAGSIRAQAARPTPSKEGAKAVLETIRETVAELSAFGIKDEQQPVQQPHGVLLDLLYVISLTLFSWLLRGDRPIS